MKYTSISVSGSSIACPTDGSTCTRILNAASRLSDLDYKNEMKLDAMDTLLHTLVFFLALLQSITPRRCPHRHHWNCDHQQLVKDRQGIHIRSLGAEWRVPS